MFLKSNIFIQSFLNYTSKWTILFWRNQNLDYNYFLLIYHDSEWKSMSVGQNDGELNAYGVPQQ